MFRNIRKKESLRQEIAGKAGREIDESCKEVLAVPLNLTRYNINTYTNWQSNNH